MEARKMDHLSVGRLEHLSHSVVIEEEFAARDFRVQSKNVGRKSMSERIERCERPPSFGVCGINRLRGFRFKRWRSLLGRLISHSFVLFLFLLVAAPCKSAYQSETDMYIRPYLNHTSTACPSI